MLAGLINRGATFWIQHFAKGGVKDTASGISGGITSVKKFLTHQTFFIQHIDPGKGNAIQCSIFFNQGVQDTEFFDDRRIRI